MKSSLLNNPEVKSKSIESFKKQTVVKRVTGRAVCSVAAKRLVTKALQVHKEHAGSLLKIVRTVQSIQIKGAEDFGEGCHTASTEPYFYDSAYEPVKRDYALPIDECGKCVLASEITDDDKSTKRSSKPKPMKWACTIECKKLNDDEVHAIIELKESFDQPVEEVRQALDVCDSDCPNLHFTKRVYKVVVDHESDP